MRFTRMYMQPNRVATFIVRERLTIWTNCWEDMQRPVVSLHNTNARTGQAKEDAVSSTDRP